MKHLLYLILLLVISFPSISQVNLVDQAKLITDEGKKLYRSELASWNGTDIFLSQYKERENIGGYFSYLDSEVPTCIFFSKGDDPHVIGSVKFDGNYDVNTAVTDLKERPLTKTEKDLAAIRNKALYIVSNDSLFKVYQNTDLNLVPIISEGSRKVYVLTGPKNDGVIIFGNDYLLTFDNNNNLVSQKQLHKNIMAKSYSKEDTDEERTVGGMHTHLPETGDFITPTDICTLMLYEKFAKWKSYTVVSKNYVSLWNCENNSLIIITTEAMNKIDKQQKKRRKGEDF